jgi:hypothetical protein
MPEKSNRSIHQPSEEAQAALANMKDNTEASVLMQVELNMKLKIKAEKCCRSSCKLQQKTQNNK